MRRRDTYWSVFHKPEKRQIDDLKTDAVETIYEVLPKADRGDWLVWREGFATWKPITDFPLLLQSLRKGNMMNAASQPAPAPAQREIETRLASSAERAAASAPQQTQQPTQQPQAQSAPAAKTASLANAETQTAPVARPETTVQDRLSRQGNIESDVDFDIVAEGLLGDRDLRYRKKWQVRIITDGKPLTFTTVDVSNRGFSVREGLPRGLPQYFNVEVIAQDMTVPLICSEIPSSNGQPSTRLRIEVNHNPSLWQAALLS